MISPAFTGTKGIVYVLPETRPTREVFNSYDAEEGGRRKLAVRQEPISLVGQ